MQNNIPKTNFSEDTFEEFDLKEYFYLMFENKLPIIIFTFLSFIISLGFAINKKYTWEGQFQIVLQKESESSGAGSVLGNLTLSKILNKSNNTLKTELEILKSPSVLNPIFIYVKNEKEKSNKSAKDLKFGKWKKSQLSIDFVPNTKIVSVSYYDQDKESILPVLTKISNKYKKYSASEREKKLNNSLTYVEDQIKTYSQKSLNSLKKLQNYAIEHDLSPIQSKPNNNSFAFLEIEKTRVRAKNTIKTIDSILDQLDSLDTEEANKLLFIATKIPSLKESILPKTIQEINDLDKKITNDKSIFKKNDIAITKNLEVKKMLLELLKTQSIDYLLVNKKIQQDIINQSERPKGVLVKFKQLLRNAYRDENTLSNLENSKRVFVLEQSKQLEPWKLITEPTLFDTAVGLAKKKIVLFGTGIGLFITMLIILIKHQFNTILYSEKQLKSIIPFPLLASLKINSKDWELKLKFILSETIKAGNEEKLCFINYGNIDENILEKFTEVIKQIFKDDDFVITNNLIESNNFKNKILITSSGVFNNNNLEDLVKMLNLQSIVPVGWIYIDNFNFNLIS